MARRLLNTVSDPEVEVILCPLSIVVKVLYEILLCETGFNVNMKLSSLF